MTTRHPLRRAALPALALTLALAACSGTPDGSEAASTTPAESAPAASSDSAPSSAPSEEAPASPTPSSATPANSSTDEDLVDGVRTNAFGALPRTLGEMTQQSIETNPTEHKVEAHYRDADQTSFLVLNAFIPAEDDGTTDPAQGFDDAVPSSFYDGALDALRQEHDEVTEFTHTSPAGSRDWRCISAHGSSNSDRAHPLGVCQTIAHGRLVEAQYGLGTPSIDTFTTTLRAHLDDIATGLDELPRE